MVGLYGGCDVFAILRPTNPFRTAATIQRAWDTFKKMNRNAHGIRAVHMWNPWTDEGHPGKMYEIKGDILIPLYHGTVKLQGYHVMWQDAPTQSLPYLTPPNMYDAGRIYLQNGSLEMYFTHSINQHNARVVAPFITRFHESLDLNTIHDWNDMLWLVENRVVSLPRIDKEPYIKPEPYPWEVDENI
jgi:N-acylneuraminate cytidylyltransferase